MMCFFAMKRTCFVTSMGISASNPTYIIMLAITRLQCAINQEKIKLKTVLKLFYVAPLIK